ncbi:LysM peptidoglycan-binding domain-containing protein [Lawsonibacter sp. NSJ-51]|uniref:LysM peptidoglycan-binding domain-containing protein n=1 Tax=Lawsonibacter hominis TaxID=2763053 RepID=A0A8J6JH49_9FIRM|nr:LysM peptidoglycan-binding domain-containing protein [Lawsonibacter hominis]
MLYVGGYPLGHRQRHGATVAALAPLNRIADPDLIVPGQVLELPA